MAEENDQSGNNNSDTILPSESNVCNENASPEPKSFMEELVSKIDNEIANGDYIAVEEIEEEDPFETMVAEGLSQLGRSADGTMQENGLQSIEGISSYNHLQILDVSHNELEDLTTLSNLPNLISLDASHNKLSTVLEFQPPLSLRSMNKLKRIENIGSLKHLQLLDLSYNAIRSLRGLQSHDLLDTIRLRNNEIIDLSEVRYIRDLPLLRVLDLSYNPIQDFPDYRLSIVFRIPRLVELDNIPVQPEEKVASENLFKPRLDIIAARNHMMNLVRSYLQPIKLYNSTLSSTETPYPMLVLTGPSGCGKRTLIKKLCQEFPNFFGEGVSYTTRGLRENEKVPRESEVDGTDYHFTTKDDFERDTVAGKFISTSHLYNSQYGISRDAIEAVAKEGLACALHLELEGVMVLKNTHFEPRYILILPETKQAQEERMRSKKFYSDSHINQAIERVALYVETNREHPGYFDTVICSDDLEESYKQLKRVVLEYLGISPVNSSVSCISRSTHESEISPVSLSEVTRPISTPYDKESLTASAVKPWIRTSAGSRALESNNHTNLPRSAKSPVAQEERMRSKKFYSDSHINQAIERVALYVETNREHPGYFDTVICSDDLEESYKQLKRVVLEYLGISPVNSSVSCISRSTHESEISPVSLSEVTRPISTPYDKESLTASAVKPWIRTSAGSRALESNNHTNLPRSAKSPVEAASIQRRFEMMKAATVGITSTSEEQLSKLKPPLSANGLSDSWAFEDIPAHKRASSAPNGLASSYSKPRLDDETDSEKETVDSDISSAHASYMVNANEYEDSGSENEDDKTSYSTTRTTITS
eukprot:gene2088-17659_t